MTKEEVLKMMSEIKKELIYEDEDVLEYINGNYGEAICFYFENGILVDIRS